MEYFCQIHKLHYQMKVHGKEGLHNNFGCYNFHTERILWHHSCLPKQMAQLLGKGMILLQGQLQEVATYEGSDHEVDQTILHHQESSM